MASTLKDILPPRPYLRDRLIWILTFMHRVPDECLAE